MTEQRTIRIYWRGCGHTTHEPWHMPGMDLESASSSGACPRCHGRRLRAMLDDQPISHELPPTPPDHGTGHDG
jgi:hypothetical protein